MERVSFVTGATGQIGLPLVRALLASGHQVRALVRKEAAAAEVAAAGARLVVGTLEDRAALDEGMAGASHVWHLAGGIRGEGAMDADRLNRVGTEQVLAAAERHGRLEGFLYASSCAVYGDRSGLWVPEDYPASPQTEYGTAKLAAERLVADAHARSGLPTRIARIAAVYGPGLRFTMADAMRKGRAWLPGEGRNHVPLVHIDDCVTGLIRVGLQAPGGSVVHVSAPSTPTLKEFYAAVHKRVGGTPVRFWSTWIPSVFQFGAARRNEALQARIGRKPRFTPDNLRLMTASVRLRVDKLERELGFEWRYADFREGLAASFPTPG